MKFARTIAPALLLAMAATVPQARAASGYDLGDLWWNPQESGWGIQLTQQRDVAFATLYVQGGDGRPVWYTAVLNFEGLAAQTHEMAYSGDLYETTGTPFAAAIYGTPVNRKVGTMRVVAPTMTSATLTYSVDGISVSKAIQRQTFRYDAYAGSYAGTQTVTYTKCDNPAENITRTEHLGYVFSIGGTTMTVVASAEGRSCTYAGPYRQDGRLGRMDATYTCSNGEVGAMAFEEMNVQRFGVMGRLFGANNRGCHIEGSFAAVLQ